MEDLRKRWELPSIAHFVSSFHRLFSLPELHVEELENAFLTSCTAEGSDLLNQLLASLLSGIYSSKNIEFYNYESPLRDYLHQKWVVEAKKQNPMAQTEFKDVSLHDKTDIVYSLCMSRLDAEDVADATKALSGEDLRIEPVGHDSQGCYYWNFNDERLYKEDSLPITNEKPKKKKHKEKHKRKKHKHRDSVESADEGDQKVTYGKWTLVCCTEEDWQTFVKQLKKSSHKQDKKLRKVIINDFIPLIPDIIEEKEKAMKRRLLEMVPKRESNRLARKRAEIDEQKAIMAKLDAEERQERRQRELEKKRIAEQKRKEEMAREREERIQAREEEKQAQAQARQDRALRAVMREQKGFGDFSLTDDGSITDESSEDTDWERYNKTAGGTHVTLSHRQRSRRNRQLKVTNGPSHFGPKEYEKINRILYQLQRNPNCWPFLEPVTKDIAPDYFDIIDKPMDISVLRRKSNKKEYINKQQFVDDFNLIVDNCAKYNGANSEYGRMAANLKDKFDSLIEKSFHDDIIRPHKTKSSAEAVRRVSYTARLTDTSSSSEESNSNNNLSDSSQSAFEEPKKSIKPRGRGRPKGSTNKKKVQSTTSKPGIGQRLSSDGESSGSESADSSSSSLYDVTSNNETKTMSMSQSTQILMDTTQPSPHDSRLLFGIARKTSVTNHSATQPTTTSIKAAEKPEQASSVTPKYVSILPPTNSIATKPDKNAELARWMGNSPRVTNPISSSAHNVTSPINTVLDSPLKVDSPPTTVQPFQTLFTELKRSSVDTSPTGPLYKRVA